MNLSRTPRRVVHAAIVLALSLLASDSASAAEWFVAVGGTGSGTKAAPFGSIQEAVNVAQPGDTVTVRAGTYSEHVRTMRHGASRTPISIRAEGERGGVVVTAAGRVLTVQHAYVTVEGFVFDGQYGLSDTVRVESSGSYLTFRNNEVRRSTRDLIDIGGPTGVVIEQCLIHHALNAANGRTDAHGIAAGPVQKLTIRNTEIHTFSGDGVQVDLGRSPAGSKDVVLESVRIWLAPLPAPANGFAAGVVPGENAIDTKASATLPRATLTLRDVTAWGFRNGLITNMAAFNLKEHISATLDRITVFDSEIAFRLRGGGSASTGAWVTLKNALVYDVTTAYRYEDNIQNLRIWNNTVGADVSHAFRAGSSGSSGLEVRNLLVLGSLPAEAAGASNLAVSADSFADPGRGNYRLATGSPAIDAGTTIASVTTDRDGTRRPIGGGYDVGAYEWQAEDAGNLARTPAAYLRASPGARNNDTLILPVR